MRSISRLAVVAACLLLAACFEEPIRQHLHLHLADGWVVVVWTDRVAPDDRARGNPAVAERLAAHRAELERGLTDASSWFAAVRTAADRYRVDRVGGQVRSAQWVAVMDDPGELERLLTRAGLTALVQATEDGAELYLEPAATPRATRSEREQLERTLRPWSEVVAGYLEATAAWYRYLESAPGRATATFVNLIEEAEVVADYPLTARETALLQAVADAIEEVAGVLLEIDDLPYSPNELSRRVWDPFPARLTVSAEAGLAGSEAWLTLPDGLERPPLSLWQALVELEGRWLSPDLVTAMVAPGPEEVQPEPDAFALADLPRWAAPVPTAATVENAIRERLVRDDSFVVQWSGRAPGAVELEDAAAVLGEGLRSVPR